MTQEERGYLRHSSPERESLWELLTAYWGKGDGDIPPAFVAKAAKLCGYPLQPD